MRYCLAVLRFFLFLILVVLVCLVQPLILLFTKGAVSYIVPRLWHRAVCFIFGVRVRVRGKLEHSSQTLYMSNHISYLDIPVLGSVIKGSFVAKSEVKGWALFGFLSRLQQTAFIIRKKAEIGAAKNDLAGKMADGKDLIIFPEGTSTDGREVRGFKSGLFMLAVESDNPNLLVQPVTLRVDMVDGKSVTTQEDRDLYAWHVDMDMELGPHLWRFAQGRGAVLTVTFHDALPARDYQDRKILCQSCYDAVSGGLLPDPVA